MKTWQRGAVGALIGAALGLVGCNYDQSPAVKESAVQPPPPTVIADFHESLTYPPEMVANSAEIALNELSLANVQKTFSAGAGLVTGQLPDGRKVIIEVASRSPSSAMGSNLGITIEVRSDPELTRTIESHIMAALARGGTPQSPTPLKDAEIETEHSTK